MYLKARSYASSSFPRGLPDYRRSEASDAQSDLRVANQKSKLNPRALHANPEVKNRVADRVSRRCSPIASFRVAPACCSDVVCYGSFLAYGQVQASQGDLEARLIATSA